MVILGLYRDSGKENGNYLISKILESRLLREVAYHTLLQDTNGCMFVWVAGKELQ